MIQHSYHGGVPFQDRDPSDGFREISRPSPAERRLMVAVLRTAIEDCDRTAPGTNRPRRHTTSTRQLLQAKAYVACRDRSWPYSYENLCEMLDIDPRSLRIHLGIHAATHVNPLRPREAIPSAS